MGTFYYPLTVLSLTGDAQEEVEALVDTGSTYLWLPRPLLERLGYYPLATRPFTLATGETIERELTAAQVRIGEESWPVPCVFGDEGSIPLLGTIVLEAFSFAADPINRKLISVPALATTAL